MSIVIDEGDAFVGVSNYYCRYCQNTDRALFYRYFDYSINKTIIYCRACIQMTWSTTERHYGLLELPVTHEQLENHIDFELTDQQQYASGIIESVVKTGGRRLLHAVTGAGKTEMILEGIIEARRRGESVAIVSPRVDVVKEIALRMQHYFKTEIDVLYAGQVIKFNSQFVISTVHQLMKYRRHFGLIIVDETDAFPMPMDPRLMRIVEQAARDNCAMIYLTATPSRLLLSQFKQDEIIILPRRYHNRPLPVPIFHFLTNRAVLKGRLSKRLRNRKHGTVLLIFFNDIALMEHAAEIYKEFKPLTVYAGYEKRHDKVEQIRAGQHAVVMTTTILERGFTMEKLDVWIVNSGHFTAECLIQMAGRVDRKREHYAGEVLLFHEGVTFEMLKAVKEIKRMNKL